jgi:hypothetical protein
MAFVTSVNNLLSYRFSAERKFGFIISFYFSFYYAKQDTIDSCHGNPFTQHHSNYELSIALREFRCIVLYVENASVALNYEHWPNGNGR